MSVLGHELRGPLTAIRGAATLLVEAHDELPHDRVLELLRLIDSQAARMADRVEDVLVAGRLHGDRQPVLLEAVELSEVITDVIEATRAQAGGRPIRAPARLEGVTVLADSQRLAQVLRLLLDNAVSLSPPDTPIEVGVEQVAGAATISVLDRGPGVAPADRVRIFERGVKLAAGGPGAGLGLYVAAGLLGLMNGTLGVEARAGGGSSFWFTVPILAK